MYTSPFIISSKAIHLIAEILAQIERYAIRMEQDDALLFRKAGSSPHQRNTGGEKRY